MYLAARLGSCDQCNVLYFCNSHHANFHSQSSTYDVYHTFLFTLHMLIGPLILFKMKQKVIVIGAGPVGALSALYAAQRGHDVEVYELRNGTLPPLSIFMYTDKILKPFEVCYIYFTLNIAVPCCILLAKGICIQVKWQCTVSAISIAHSRKCVFDCSCVSSFPVLNN